MAKHIEKITIPDIGGAENVDVIEVLVAVGDHVKAEDSLITLEGDKATMEVPSPQAGVVESVHIKVGDKVSEGDLIVSLQAEGANAEAKPVNKKAPSSDEKPKSVASDKQETKQAAEVVVYVPDIGGAQGVDVIEVMVKAGDSVEQEQSIITLESDKASMEVPSPQTGKVGKVFIKVGDKVSEGDKIMTVLSESTAPQAGASSKQQPAKSSSEPAEQSRSTDKKSDKAIHAGPAVRRTSHEFDIDLNVVPATGPKGRITRQDIRDYVKRQLAKAESGGAAGFAVASAPRVDFSKFGEIETQPLSKIQKSSGANLHRNWVSIPHVTQFGEADITELEEFRQEQKGLAAKRGIKLTPLAFLLKAAVAALKEFPNFNASLDPNGVALIVKKYFHIGVAVDTPNGLVVPVLRDVDKKGLFDLAAELGEVSERAREGKLTMKDMQGGCFSISSLGGIGGTAFTPIINAPEVAILGVSRSAMKPHYDEQAGFVPRLMLPLSLSYDHRVIDGADGARFMVSLTNNLSDIRTLLL